MGYLRFWEPHTHEAVIGIALYEEHEEMVRELQNRRSKARAHLERAAELDKERDADLRSTLLELAQALEDQADEAEGSSWRCAPRSAAEG